MIKRGLRFSDVRIKSFKSSRFRMSRCFYPGKVQRNAERLEQRVGVVVVVVLLRPSSREQCLR